MAKLQNVKAVRSMIDGNHRTQTKTTVGYENLQDKAEKAKRREVGDTWEQIDSDGKVIAIWTQRDGYRTKSSPHQGIINELRTEMATYPHCEDDCSTETFTRLDERIRSKFGRCADCQFRFENKLKQSNRYEEYERAVKLSNANAFFNNADKEIDVVAKELDKGFGYVANVSGKEEKWDGEELEGTRLKVEYNEFKEIVLSKLRGE